jgi:Asp-tRNA(Asn)/Glu-tRNA(Gln) amidotransferase A subunit family amidase/tetratricopeptide (TPR) repeat protein
MIIPLVLAAAAPLGAQRAVPKPDIVFEASITELQDGLAKGRYTSAQLVDAYLARIAAYDQKGPALNAMVRLNPRARADAAARDAERKAGRVRGPLHGIPIILKDNYNTADIPTTGASIALAGLVPPKDAFQVRKLRDAGAVIIGKANMHELAAGITTIASLGGQTCNPYDPDRYPGGSSGGTAVAVAASFAAIAWGSDTCGSIRIPSAFQNLFGLRPTKGLSSIDGIIPLSHTQDVGGPLARTVMDLAIGLDATVGPDPADTATRILDGKTLPSFVRSLDTSSLRGTRLGVLTSYFGTESDDQEAGRVVRAAIDRLKARGAEVVEVSIPGLDSVVNNASVINYEFKYDLIDYLSQNRGAPVTGLQDILDKGLFHTELEGTFRRRNASGTRDSDAYRAALRRRTRARDIVVGFLDANRLDAIVYPTMRRKPSIIGEGQAGSTCTLSAVTGLPAISMPAGFTPDSLPLGVELLGRPLADARLVSFAYDYEQSTRPRRAPSTTPPLIDGRGPRPDSIVATATANGVTVRGRFRFDRGTRRLDYNVNVAGIAPAQLLAVSLDRGTVNGNTGMLRRLIGPQSSLSTQGSLELRTSERSDLLSGRMYLTVFTTTRPTGAVRTLLAIPGGMRATSPFASGVEAISFLGDTLRTLPLSAEVRARYERQLAEARAAYERAPTDADSIIWYGRRLAYVGRIREAIDVYTRGIALYPDNPWLYRHRGHRYISVREIDRAIADLERAANLVQGKPDVVEPDGQPNARNMPIGTLHSNIDYHLALAYYLKGDYERALPIYRREVKESRNDDRLVSISHWLYMSLRRLKRDTEAADVLKPIRRDMNVIENGTYQRLLLMYKGELPQDSVLTVGPNGEMSVTDATAAYGVGNWHLYNGRAAEAEQIFKRILAGGQWGAFGYIAAEAELARNKPRGRDNGMPRGRDGR